MEVGPHTLAIEKEGYVCRREPFAVAPKTKRVRWRLDNDRVHPKLVALRLVAAPASPAPGPALVPPAAPSEATAPERNSNCIPQLRLRSLAAEETSREVVSR